MDGDGCIGAAEVSIKEIKVNAAIHARTCSAKSIKLSSIERRCRTRRWESVMKSSVIAVCVSLSLLAVATSVAEAGDRSRKWCRHLQNSDSPMVWSEGYGVSSCNDRAATPYRPWNSAAPVRRNQDDPMTARDDWRVSDFSKYDNRYDDRYDRRSRRYR
jgi:hypothetical protein